MRRLVVCADGTWKSELDSSDATNVQLLREAVLPTGADGTPQLATYLPGVGTRRFERLRGGAFGVGLSDNVKHAYRWLVEHLEDPTDELYLFGFSRGAYTVRSLAGLVRNVGVLHPDSADLVDEAYAHYRDRSHAWRPDGAEAGAFRAAHSRDLPHVRCIGVWDTVGALGVPLRGPLGWLSRRRYGFHDVTLSSRVQYGFQALAIDEQRAAFPPTLWQVDAASAGQQTVEQVWFAGVHSNVGGGYPRSHVSDLALAWMAQRAASTGLALDLASLPSPGPELCAAGLANSRTGAYRLEPPHVRRIGADPVVRDGRTLLTYESVHESVAERRRVCTAPPAGPYAPANLADYLRRTAAPVARQREPVDDLPVAQSGPRPSDR